MDLQTFLKPTKPTMVEKEVVISDRYVDEKGEPVKFKIRSLTPSGLQELQDEATQVVGKGKKQTVSIKNKVFNNNLIIESLIEPNLKSAELQNEFKVMGAEPLIDLLFNSKEYLNILNEVLEINGLNDETNNLDNDIKVAKN